MIKKNNNFETYEISPELIKKEKKNGLTAAEISKKYGIPESYIRQIYFNV